MGMTNDAWRQDNETKLRQMVEQMGPRLYRFAWAMLTNKEAADDVVQECFVRYWRQLDKEPGRNLGPGWLLRVTARLCLDEGRRRGRRQETLERLSDLWRTNAPCDDPAAGPDQEIFSLVMQLKPKDRLTMLLVYYQDLPLAEAASILGTTETFLKTKLSRIRKRLKKEWERGQ